MRTGSRGVPVHQVPGLPRFGEVRFTGEYPLAHLDFEDGATERPFPVRVSLDAFSPMIPGNTEDSGLPAAILSWNLENRTERRIKALLAAVASNLVGYQFSPWPGGQQVNRTVREPEFQGVLMESERDGGRHPMAGSMAAVTPWPETTLQTRLGEQDWPYSLRPFWYQLLGRAPFEQEEDATVAAPSGNPTVARRLEAALGMSITLDPGQSVTVPVILTWRFPNRYVQLPDVDEPRWVGNEYTQRFPSADEVARYVVVERERLEAETRDFHRHLYATTVPDFVIDAVSGNMATIRTQTCFRDASGQFYAYEGCNPDSGCCPMNCTHVWMYEQALASLYPSLERDMRANAFLVETEPDGRMFFRTRTPSGAEPFLAEATTAADGQMAEVIQLLRAHEVWSGCEYEVACLMIQEGLLAEGESIVEAIRSRHDGAARNPWNEPECGDHYARAMASYGLLQAYARLQIDLSRGRIALSPQVNRENFSTFFSVEGAWGTIKLSGNQLSIDLGSGKLAVNELVVDGRTVPLPAGITVEAGQPLHVRL